MKPVHRRKGNAILELPNSRFSFISSAGLIHDTERRKSDGGLSAMAPLKVSLIQDMR